MSWVRFLIHAFAIVFGFGLSAYAGAPAKLRADPGAFGFEFTLSPDDLELRRAMAQYDYPSEVWDPLRENYRKFCAQAARCRFSESGPVGFVLTYPDGFYLSFMPDPWVVEVTFPKLTAQELTLRAAEIDAAVFGQASHMKLHPLRSLGGGHVNMDVLSHFGDDTLALIDFIEDSVYHHEMFRHISRTPNSASGEMVGQTYDGIRKGLLRARELATGPHPPSMKEILKILNEVPYAISAFNKHTAIALHLGGKHPESWRIEFRTPKPQKSAEEALRFTDMLTLRKQYLKRNPRSSGLPSRSEIPDPKSAEEAEEFFSKYILEMGDDPAYYVPILREDIAAIVVKKRCPLLFDSPSAAHP